MKQLALRCIGCIGIGALLMTGMRIIENVIPAPAARIYVCMVGEDDSAEVCKKLSEIKNKEGS